MKKIQLIKINHNVKIGEQCEYFKPNIVEDCIFYENDKPIGFYLTKMPEYMCKLADIANAEFNSKNVKKTVLGRKKTDGVDEKTGKYKYKTIEQLSTIIGAVPPKPHMKRQYATISTLHLDPKAQTFIKAMLMLSKESGNLIKEILPEQYYTQLEIFKKIEPKWKFGDLFTSSISNYNISAPFHIDKANIPNTVNVIICKRLNSIGGDLHLPDYNLTIGQKDNSILVYPAWKSIHGVTPIIPTQEGGYRNSLVFYPLKYFYEHGIRQEKDI